MPDRHVIYSLVSLEKGIENMNITPDGIISAFPYASDVGLHQAAVIAVRDDCAGILIINFKVYSKPQLTGYTPNTVYFQVEQATNITFSVKATTEAINTKFDHVWMLDGVVKKVNSSRYVFNTGALLGMHNMTVNMTDKLNLSRVHTWTFNVTKKGLAPILREKIPDVLIYNNTASSAYDLDEFFYDPEGGVLQYSYNEVESSYQNLSRADIIVNISSGFVSYIPINGKVGYAFIKFFATDDQNITIESNQVKIDVSSTFIPDERNNSQLNFFCGDSTCNGNENCTTCPSDCGKCEEAPIEGCLPIWSCEDWSLCKPEGKKYRFCFDQNNCNDNRTAPITQIKCNYVDYCFNKVKDNNESGIDCGGACSPCTSCHNGILDGNETEIDCGGNCGPCASCNNGIRDGNETDVDCGSKCLPCAGGNSCKVNRDCESLLCKYLVCEYPSCSDQIKNQGEIGIDCEGPCEATCNTCNDNIKNGNEEQIDCGGGCRPCPTCDDGKKNGKELFTDCGGNCRSCTILDFFSEYNTFLIILASVIVFLATAFLAYLTYLVSNPESASEVYNRTKFFNALLFINNLFRPFRRLINKKPYLTNEQLKDYDKKLTNIISKKNYTNREYYDLLIRIVSEIGAGQTNYGKVSTYELLQASTLPNIMKIFIVGYTKKIEVLAGSTFVTAEQKIDFETKMRFLLSELSKP